MPNRYGSVEHPSLFAKGFLDNKTDASIKDMASFIKMTLAETERFLKGQIDVDTELAVLLGKFFNTTPEFWAYQQVRFDLNKFKEERQATAVDEKKVIALKPLCA